MAIFQLLFIAIDVLQPILGIVFFFTGVDIGLYICGAYGVLFALQRIPRGDIGPIVDVVVSILLAAIIPINGYNTWQLASAFVCIYDAWVFVSGVFMLIKIKKESREYEE